MTIYFLSGLGVDQSIFKYLNLDLPESSKIVYLNWIPVKQNEPISDYARRISDKINNTEPFILIGLSFGGIIATEIANILSPVKVILISSVASRNELPIYFRIAGKLKLYKLIPTGTFNYPNFLIYWLFGINNLSDKKFLRQLLVNSDKSFSKWAIQEIFNWANLQVKNNLIRIHGSKDRILPIINFQPNYLIKDGGHFMIVNMADEISSIIRLEIGLR